MQILILLNKTNYLSKCNLFKETQKKEIIFKLKKYTYILKETLRDDIQHRKNVSSIFNYANVC